MTYHFPTRRSAVLPARWVVRNGGLEPPRLAAPAPKAGASTNSATFAIPGSLPVQARFYARGGEGGKEAKKSTSPDSGERVRSEEHTSELQSLMRISYAVFCLKKKNNKTAQQETTDTKYS